MITGGTGSFGNAVLNRILDTNVKEVRILSRDEKKQDDMRLAYNSPKLKFYLGDVRNYDSVHDATIGVNYLFHAAALKQVPSTEFHPMEAVRTNILGAGNVMDAAIANQVERVIVLSSDKAVYPINVMGMSKALMEKLMISKARTHANGKTIFCATRFGNIVASRGSVIPLFIKQLQAGQPLTITEPMMTRFLMTLDDAVDLGLHAFTHGQAGDIFVRKTPAASIEVVAQALQELFQHNNKITVIGARHGEKLYESLLTAEELTKAEDQGLYFRIPADNRDLHYSKDNEDVQPENIPNEDYTSHNTSRLDVTAVKDLLLKLGIFGTQLN